MSLNVISPGPRYLQDEYGRDEEAGKGGKEAFVVSRGNDYWRRSGPRSPRPCASFVPQQWNLLTLGAESDLPEDSAERPVRKDLKAVMRH